jgi:hypothetical protein
LVSSPDPASARQFLDPHRIHRLEHTRLLTVLACGDAFTVSRIEMSPQAASQELMSERVNLAREVFSIFT